MTRPMRIRRAAKVGLFNAGYFRLLYMRGERVVDIAAEHGVKPHHIYAAWRRFGMPADYRQFSREIDAAVDRLMQATSTDRKEPVQ